jgi:hypothetical protein
MGRPSAHALLLICDGGLHVLHLKLEALQRADGATLTGRVLGERRKGGLAGKFAG